MRIRRIALHWLTVGLAGACASGCAGIGAATQSVSDTTSQVNTTSGTLDSAKGTADANKDKLKSASGKSGGGKGGDPDSDGTRATARESKPNEPITDNLDPKKGDSVDWKAFDLGGRPGLATVQINWDEDAADLAIDVYDAFGAQLAASPPRGPSTAKKVLVRIDATGKYYVRISTLNKVATDYTMMLKWGDGSSPPPPPPVATNQVPNAAGAGGGAPSPSGGVPAAPAPGAAAPALPPADDPMHPRCKIVQSYRDDDGRMVLYIDKGSAVGIRVEMTGFILDGKDEKKLDGGDFTFSKVIDGTHSVAKSSIPKVGRNNHCVINLVR